MNGRLPLSSHPVAASHARQFLTRTCAHLSTTTLEVAHLLVSELVSNAVRHGRPDIVMTYALHPDHLRIEVEDGDPTPPGQPEFSVSAEDGRGLLIVSALADRWGMRPLPHGKSMWFDLSLEPG